MIKIVRLVMLEARLALAVWTTANENWFLQRLSFTTTTIELN